MSNYQNNRKKQVFRFSKTKKLFYISQGNLDSIDFEKPLDILAYQYDIVCNGVELSSGAIRNHIPELMYKLFSIAGYDKDKVDKKFNILLLETLLP